MRQLIRRLPRVARLTHGSSSLGQGVSAGEFSKQPVETPVFLADDDQMPDLYDGTLVTAAPSAGRGESTRRIVIRDLYQRLLGSVMGTLGSFMRRSELVARHGKMKLRRTYCHNVVTARKQVLQIVWESA
jgi:hypothetical protein